MTYLTDAMMIAYFILALVVFSSSGWDIPGGLLFIINITNFLLFQFIRTNKYLTAVVLIFTGFMSYFLLSGVMSTFGLILGIYGIVFAILLVFYIEYD